MKKVILGAILTAGAVLAQSSGTPAPATSGAGSTNGKAPAAQGQSTPAPVKKHKKANKAGSTANVNKSNTPATNGGASGSGTGNAATKPATPAAPAK
jgi:hypothetical protein